MNRIIEINFFFNERKEDVKKKKKNQNNGSLLKAPWRGNSRCISAFTVLSVPVQPHAEPCPPAHKGRNSPSDTKDDVRVIPSLYNIY